jgi:hypothetical protein
MALFTSSCQLYLILIESRTVQNLELLLLVVLKIALSVSLQQIFIMESLSHYYPYIQIPMQGLIQNNLPRTVQSMKFNFFPYRIRFK